MKKRVQLKKERQEPTITHTPVTSTLTRTVTRTSTVNLEEAIEAVYRKYGTNLSALFRDAFQEAAKHHERGKTAAKAEAHPL
jgi:predicted nucleic acid-binding protein